MKKVIAKNLLALFIQLKAEGADFQYQEIKPLLPEGTEVIRNDDVCATYGERAVILYLRDIIVVFFEGGNQWLSVQEIFIPVK